MEMIRLTNLTAFQMANPHLCRFVRYETLEGTHQNLIRSLHDSKETA